MTEWEYVPDIEYDKVLRTMKEELKRYLGYPPHNTKENTFKRNPQYLQSIESRYGRTLSELLAKTGMEDYGETPPPAESLVPHNSIIKALKRLYGVEPIYFWREPEWQEIHWICTTKKEFAKKERIDSDQLKRLLRFLDGELKSRNHPKIKFLDTGNEHTTLDGLREDLLVLKLSGLLE